MAAPTRPLTSTAVLADALELRCPGPSSRGDGTCGRLLSKAGLVAVSYQVSQVCPRCHHHTTFEVPACG